MKLTKYSQSCVMVETKGEKIVVDPGNIGVTDELISKCADPDVILITHKHGDHCDIETINKIRSDKTKIYTSKEVSKKFPELKAEIATAGYNISVGEVLIEVVKAVHGYLPHLKGDNEIHEGLGFIIDREKKVYFVGDSISFKNEYKCDVLFVPVNNHGVCMGPFAAAQFAKETNAELVIPYHLDNPKLPADIPKVKEEFDKAGLNYKFLEAGETIEL